MADNAAERRLLEEIYRTGRRRKLFREYERVWDPEVPAQIGAYPWQRDFHNAGRHCRERLIIKANRVGGTTAAAAEVACHLTGEYPEWWDGRRFTDAVLGWAGGETTEAIRDIIQEQLLGSFGEWGTGWIPASRLVGKPKLRQAGVADVVDQIFVRHVSGAISTLGLKTYEQGREKWQGRRLNFVWFDEQPPMDIYTEGLTRVMDTNGIVMVTFTPLKGADEVVQHFINAREGSGIWMRSVTWDDAPHLTEQMKEDFLKTLPEHERDTRSKGIPIMGSGAVFPVPDDQIMIDPRDIPRWWARINGLDFGIDHPAATAFCAWDRDTDTFYVYDCWKGSGQTPVYHSAASKKHGKWIPHAWPRDGLKRDAGSGQVLMKQYREHDLVMLPEFASYKDERGVHVEPGLIEMLEYMRTGRFKVFRGLAQWFEEKRFYHRDEGVIVPKLNDLMDATRYAFVMRRMARSAPPVVTPRNNFTGPIGGPGRWRVA